MKFRLLIGLGILTLVGKEASELKNFNEGNEKFTADIYKAFLKESSGNFLICPLSLEIILALVHAGAGGNTAKQLSETLHFPEDTESIQKLISKLVPSLQVDGDYQLTTLNKIYVAEGAKIKKEFKNIAKTVFESDIENIDFCQSKDSALKINQWVEKATQNKIRNLVTEDCMNSDTLAILINTMYFNGNWSFPFETKATKVVPFHVSKTHKIDTEMMVSLGVFGIYFNKELGAKFLEMTYEGEDIAMTIVLPDEIDGLSRLENRISEVFIRPDYSEFEMMVNVPKFKIESTTKFKSMLETLGVKDAFTSSADLTKMIDSDRHPYINDVIQKTFIEVTEKGTTAGTATCVPVFDKMVPSNMFYADHPFLFYLRHKVNGIFFIGRYVTPNND